MRVLLWEYLTSGAFPGGAAEKAALAVEGAAMLRALAADAGAVSGFGVTVLWDAASEPFGVPGVGVLTTDSPARERELFRRLTAETDATFALAPEFDGLLEDRRRLVDAAGGRFLGSAAEAIALCGDKLTLADHLARHGVPTIETRPCDFGEFAELIPDFGPEGAIVKPRCGAGSIGLFRVRTRSELDAARAAYSASDLCGGPIVQPFVPGLPLSIAGIATPSGVELLPVARQRIDGDDRPCYAGGSVTLREDFTDSVQAVAKQTFAAVPGLFGFFGIDLILTTDGRPLVVEINPRLTSSYHGYRRLASDNLAERILAPDARRPPVRWRPGRVEFRPDGTAECRP